MRDPVGMLADRLDSAISQKGKELVKLEGEAFRLSIDLKNPSARNCSILLLRMELATIRKCRDLLRDAIKDETDLFTAELK